MPRHWEGDLPLEGTSKGAVITLVERSTRFVLLAPLPYSHRGTDLREVLTLLITALPKQIRKTLKWDRGPQMSEHATISIGAGIQIYFCNPLSPWQRGRNKNTNCLLRQYRPKGTYMRGLTQADCDEAALSLKTRPRQTLAWKTSSKALTGVFRATAARIR